MQKFTFFVLYNFGFWLPSLLKQFSVVVYIVVTIYRVNLRWGKHVNMASGVGLWLWSIVLPSEMEPHGLEDLEEKSGCHFLLSFN